MVARWWQFDIPVLSSMFEWIDWIDTMRVPGAIRKCLDAVGLVLCWTIWCFRNKLLFDQKKPVKAWIWENVQAQSYLWISARDSKFHVSWVDWFVILVFQLTFCNFLSCC